jgi:hypothetical protein
MSDYDTIKAQEAHFPLPQPTASITVGTFNATTGAFQYAVPTHSQVIVIPPDPTHGGPLKATHQTVEGGAVTAINVIDLKLRFNITNRSGDFSVSAAGQTVHAPTGQNWVEIDPGTATSLQFALTCGQQGFSPDLPLTIDRHIVGAGAITIPALPITILYAPPVDQQKKNAATWTATDIKGTTTTLSFSNQSNTTVPIQAPVMIQPWLDLTAEMKDASQVLSKVPNATAQAIGGALGVISGLLGTSANTGTVGTTVTNQNSLTVTLGETDSLTTNPGGGGPGHADVLYYLKNARICWFTNGGPLQLALLGWDAADTITAALLEQSNGPTGLDDATREALLKLDPFAGGGPGVTLPSPRFVLVDTFDVNAPHTYNLSYSVTNSDTQQTTQTESEVEDDTASFLAFANIGVPQTVKLQWTLTQSSAATATTTRTMTQQVQFYANPSEYYSVEVYSDVIFGTFAFQSVGTTSQSLLHGQLLDPQGKRMPFSEVVLSSGGRTYRTVTDANGNFSFHAEAINPVGAKMLTKGAALGKIATV